MGQNGGARIGAGRKPKADELKLIDALSIYDAKAQEALFNGVDAGDFNYIKLFFEYRYGKPRQQVDLHSTGESMQQVMYIPEVLSTQLLKSIPEQNTNDLDNSSEENK